MKDKDKLAVLSLLVLTVVSIFTLYINLQFSLNRKPKYTYRPGIDSNTDRAVNQAKKLFEGKKELITDIESGPCLTNDLMDDWVVDLVHSPRQKIDEELQNQCQAFVEGRAKHFIELDLEGNVVRVY